MMRLFKFKRKLSEMLNGILERNQLVLEAIKINNKPVRNYFLRPEKGILSFFALRAIQ